MLKFLNRPHEVFNFSLNESLTVIRTVNCRLTILGKKLNKKILTKERSYHPTLKVDEAEGS